jgi:hypothetical protein
METPNVNNLNGVPNFGHGLPEVAAEGKPEAPEDTKEQVELPENN